MNLDCITIEEIRNQRRCWVKDTSLDDVPGLLGSDGPMMLDMLARSAEALGLDLDRRRTTEDERPTSSRMGGASSGSGSGSGRIGAAIGLIRGGRRA